MVGADRTVPDPSQWRITAPRAGSGDPVGIVFPEPMDRALLDHMITVVGPSGQVLDGRVEVASEETVWRFIPSRPWPPGDYILDINPDLEEENVHVIVKTFLRLPNTPDTCDVVFSDVFFSSWCGWRLFLEIMVFF